MRFNTKEEVKEWAKKAAEIGYKLHIERGHDLNPYCTQGARNYWQRGFDNAPACSWEHDLAWDMQYQRGRAMAELLQGDRHV